MNKIHKARRYSSTTMEDLFNEITPVEMAQTEVKMQIAIQIEELMKARNLNKSQLATMIGKNPSEITKWLSGTQNFTIDVLTEIAFAFGVNLASFFGKIQSEVVFKQELIIESNVEQSAISSSTPFDQDYAFVSQGIVPFGTTQILPLFQTYKA